MLIAKNLPTGRHTDYGFWPLKLIPRSWTSFLWSPPRKLFGNSELTFLEDADGPDVFIGARKIAEATILIRGYYYPKPIPKRGQWWIGGPVVMGRTIPICFAMTTANGIHVRFIARWDDLGFYWTCPTFTIKEVA